MSEHKITITINGHTVCVLEEAAELWPELAGNRSALLRKIAADWSRNRTEKGGRTSQTISRLDRHERILQMICDKLGIDLETINGGHHPDQ